MDIVLIRIWSVSPLLADERIAYAAIFGSGHFQIGVLLQPASFANSPALIDDIWPTIKAINEIAPRHARIVRPLLLVARPDKPFAITHKGNSKDWETLEAYAEEIDDAYVTLESRGVLVDFPGKFDEQGVVTYLRLVVQKAFGTSTADDIDFFNAGMDSLQVSIVRSGVNSLLEHFELPFKITASDIYLGPSINALSQRILHNNQPRMNSISQDGDAVAVHSTIDRYTTASSAHSPSGSVTAKSGDVIALTGSSGSLGAFLLQNLLKFPQITAIYCLTRPHLGTNATERHKAAFLRRGLDSDLLDDSRIIFIDADLSQSHLGLEQGIYEKVST